MNITHGVILAAGLGARLNALDTPKPLIKVGNKPLIVWNIERLQEAGVNHIYIVVGHRGDEIRRELVGNPFVTAELTFVEQDDCSHTGMLSSLLSLESHVREACYVTMADLVFEQNPYQAFSSVEGEIACLISDEEQFFAHSGANHLVALKEGKIEKVGRELAEANAREVGVYKFAESAFAILRSLEHDHPEVKQFDEILNLLARDGKLAVAALRGTAWFDINTPALYIRADLFCRNQYAQKGRVVTSPSKALTSFASFHRERLMETDIIIERDILKNLSQYDVIPQASAHATHFVLTDSVVDAHYGDMVCQELTKAGYNVHKLVVPAGESSKNIHQFHELADEMFSRGLTKHTFILSLGGGVVNNIAGYLASTLYRGIGLIHLATSMMSQVDASLDFKQAINSQKGKNLLGSYYPARSILIDPSVLTTLSKRHILNGLAESIKHAFTQDRAFVDLFKKYSAADMGDVAFLEETIRKTIEHKVPLLNGDTQQDKNEMLPQYGHSVGHAVEHLSAYELLHGEAVAIGMCVSAEIALLLGLCDEGVVKEHYDVLRRYELPTVVPSHMTDDDVCSAIRYDKHFSNGRPHMALLADIGKPVSEKEVHGLPIELSVLKKALAVNRTRT